MQYDSLKPFKCFFLSTLTVELRVCSDYVHQLLTMCESVKSIFHPFLNETYGENSSQVNYWHWLDNLLYRTSSKYHLKCLDSLQEVSKAHAMKVGYHILIFNYIYSIISMCCFFFFLSNLTCTKRKEKFIWSSGD